MVAGSIENKIREMSQEDLDAKTIQMLREAATTIRKLVKHGTRLRKYVHHDEGCNTNSQDPTVEQVCTCGLDAALKEPA